MATAPEEMEDLERITGALLVNIGTLTTAAVEGMRKAGSSSLFSHCLSSFDVTLCVGFHANAFRKPVVFDPVGVGASQFRRDSVNGETRLPLGGRRCYETRLNYRTLESLSSECNQRKRGRTRCIGRVPRGWTFLSPL